MIIIGFNSPTSICISSDNTTIWTLNNNANLVNYIQKVYNGILLQDDQIVIGNSGDNIHALALSPDNSTLWVADTTSATVFTVNTQTLQVTKQLSIGSQPTSSTNGSEPWNIRISPNGTTAWVITDVDNTAISINIQTMTAGTPITVGTSPEGICISPDSNTVWIANTGSNTVQPINTQTLTAGTPITVGNMPTSLAITPNGDTLWVSNYNDNTVQPINTQTLTAGTPITVDTAPQSLAISPNGTTLSIIDNYNANIQTINIQSLIVNKALTMGNENCITSLTYSSNGSLWISNQCKNLIETVDFNTIITPPTLIHNILNCVPVNNVLDSETGVTQ